MRGRRRDRLHPTLTCPAPPYQGAGGNGSAAAGTQTFGEVTLYPFRGIRNLGKLLFPKVIAQVHSLLKRVFLFREIFRIQNELDVLLSLSPCFRWLLYNESSV